MAPNNHRKSLSITSGQLNHLNSEQLARLFQQAYYDKVTEVDLSANRLTELSLDLFASIYSIGTVRTLDLSNNQLTTLPGYLVELKHLEQLKVDGNPLISPSPDIVESGTDAIIEHLRQPVGQEELVGIFKEAADRRVRVLDLSERQITHVTPEIGLLVDLSVLKLNNNEIRSLPAEIGLLRNLRRLEVGVNHLGSLPLEIGRLSGLHTLLLESNSIESLPAEIGQLGRLVNLELMFNALTSLPPEIGRLTNLEELWLNHNKIDELPAEIGLLNNLRVLDLFGNELRSLPNEFFQLRNLEDLNLRENEREFSRQDFDGLTKLKYLRL